MYPQRNHPGLIGKQTPIQAFQYLYMAPAAVYPRNAAE